MMRIRCVCDENPNHFVRIPWQNDNTNLFLPIFSFTLLVFYTLIEKRRGMIKWLWWWHMGHGTTWETIWWGSYWLSASATRPERPKSLQPEVVIRVRGGSRGAEGPRLAVWDDGISRVLCNLHRQINVFDLHVMKPNLWRQVFSNT